MDCADTQISPNCLSPFSQEPRLGRCMGLIGVLIKQRKGTGVEIQLAGFLFSGHSAKEILNTFFDRSICLFVNRDSACTWCRLSRARHRKIRRIEDCQAQCDRAYEDAYLLCRNQPQSPTFNRFEPTYKSHLMTAKLRRQLNAWL